MAEIVKSLLEAHRNKDAFIFISFHRAESAAGEVAVEVNCHYDHPVTKEAALEFLKLELSEDEREAELGLFGASGKTVLN